MFGFYSILFLTLLNFRRNSNTLFCRYANKNRIFFWGGRFFRNGNNFIETHLNKTHFLLAGSSFGLPSVVSRSSLGKTRQGTREVQRTRILIIVLNTKKEALLRAPLYTLLYIRIFFTFPSPIAYCL